MKIENEIDAPIEIPDSDDEDNGPLHALNNTNGSQIHSIDVDVKLFEMFDLPLVAFDPSKENERLNEENDTPGESMGRQSKFTFNTNVICSLLTCSFFYVFFDEHRSSSQRCKWLPNSSQ